MHMLKMCGKTFNMKTVGDYHDLYLLTDVLLLADCFENFRKTCLLFYGLDPAHYFTAPGLSWDAALKMTKVKLELLTDVDMHLMVEKGEYFILVSILKFWTHLKYFTIQYFSFDYKHTLIFFRCKRQCELLLPQDIPKPTTSIILKSMIQNCCLCS